MAVQFKDYYETLGVPRTASEADIRKHYRKLARQYHPDVNPGDKRAEAKFKELNAANDILSDPDKRAKFDRGEIDAQGTEKPKQRYYRDFATAQGDETGCVCATPVLTRLVEHGERRLHQLGLLTRVERNQQAGNAHFAHLLVDRLD